MSMRVHYLVAFASAAFLAIASMGLVANSQAKCLIECNDVIESRSGFPPYPGPGNKWYDCRNASRISAYGGFRCCILTTQPMPGHECGDVVPNSAGANVNTPSRTSPPPAGCYEAGLISENGGP